MCLRDLLASVCCTHEKLNLCGYLRILHRLVLDFVMLTKDFLKLETFTLFDYLCAKASKCIIVHTILGSKMYYPTCSLCMVPDFFKTAFVPVYISSVRIRSFDN